MPQLVRTADARIHKQAVDITSTQLERPWQKIREIDRKDLRTLMAKLVGPGNQKKAQLEFYIKEHSKGTFEPSWTGPHLVLLSTAMPLKVCDRKGWVHKSQVKGAPDTVNSHSREYPEEAQRVTIHR
ncbi:hypothetical protein AAFF_G00206620 [Aldrovandia affinis]|uniref:Murine leukemia virus integrase C-terminal domain-containing protein n=1 Tax=Aldrovandia affinis TaxID=143900 RepID=A0AAD7RHS0_9TELE|nr:hypothetical protein AAFF_G00206620 [Aldrovandia affinis]